MCTWSWNVAKEVTSVSVSGGLNGFGTLVLGAEKPMERTFACSIISMLGISLLIALLYVTVCVLFCPFIGGGVPHGAPSRPRKPITKQCWNAKLPAVRRTAQFAAAKVLIWLVVWLP